MFNVAKAIVKVNGKYALQLRDNSPLIDGPNEWSLFGGRIEDGETPEQGVKRELLEELDIEPKSAKFVTQFPMYSPLLDEWTEQFVFLVDLSTEWSQMKLGEGQKTDCFTVEEMEKLNMKSVYREVIKKAEGACITR